MVNARTSPSGPPPRVTSEYRIDKARARVILTIAGQRAIAGDLFVQPYTRHRDGPEHPEDVLNAPDAFLPFFVVATAETILVAKDRLLEVLVYDTSGVDAFVEAGIRATAVEVLLAGGETRIGTLYLEARNDRPRLLDVLNQIDRRFFLLNAPDGVRFINRRFVDSVRPLD